MKQGFSKCYVILIVLSVCFLQTVKAQLTDLARIEYSYIPNNNSEDHYRRLRAVLNYPIKIKSDDYLIIGGEYNRILLNLEDEYPFDTNQLKRLHVIDFSLGYTFKTSEHWRLGAKITPRIASTLTDNLSMQDVFINGGIFAIKDRSKDKDLDKPYRLVLGLTYNSTAGVPFPLPFISYYRQINNSWSYNIGVPKSSIKHIFNEKNIIQVFAGLDGYFANIQKPIVINQEQVDNISLSVAVGGVGYEYCFTKHLIAYSYIGYTFILSNHLRDENRDNVYKLNDLNTFYFRSGIKLKI